MNRLIKLITEKPYLAWYIKNRNRMSKESILEHVLNYGNWEDYIDTEKALGIANVKEIFNKLKNKTRTNLQEKTINYFDKYFERYA